MSTLTQEQRDRKNANLRAARAAAKAREDAGMLPVQTATVKKPTPAKKAKTPVRRVPAQVPPPVASPTAHARPRKPGSGGARSNSGKQVAAGDIMVVIAFRGTPAQKKKMEALGGGAWVRQRIDAAKAP